MRKIVFLFLMLLTSTTNLSYSACTAEGKNLILSIQNEMSLITTEIAFLSDQLASEHLGGWPLHVVEFTLGKKKEDLKNGKILLENTIKLTECDK